MRGTLGAVDTRLLVVLLAIATVFRVGFLLADPHPGELGGLSSGEAEVARNIVDHGEWFVVDERALEKVNELQVRTSTLIDPSAFDYTRYDADPHRVPQLIEPLGPGLILAALWTITGDQSYIWLQLLQLVIGVCLTLVVIWLSLALFKNARAAIAAGALWAVSPTLSYLGTLPLYEIWAVFAALGITALYVGTRRRGSPVAGLLMVGLAIGVGTLFRQSILLLVPALALAEFGTGRKQALRTGIVVSAGCLLALIPWTLRNLHEFDQVRPTNGVVGQVLWEGLGEDTSTFAAVNDDGVTLREVHASRPDLRYGTPAYDSYLRERALDAIADHPPAYAVLAVRRTLNGSVLNASPWPRDAISSWDEADRSPFSFVLEHPLFALELGIAAVFDPLLFLGALISTLALWRLPLRRELLLLWLVWASVMVVPVLISGSHWRYVAPGLPFLMVMSGLGIDLLWRYATDRSRGLEPKIAA